MNLNRVTLPSGKTVFMDDAGNIVDPRSQAPARPGVPAPPPRPKLTAPEGFTIMRTPDRNGGPGPLVYMHQDTGVVLRREDHAAFVAALAALKPGESLLPASEIRRGTWWNPVTASVPAPADAPAAPSNSAEADAPAPASEPVAQPPLVVPPTAPAQVLGPPPWALQVLVNLEALTSRVNALGVQLDELRTVPGLLDQVSADLTSQRTVSSSIGEDVRSIAASLVDVQTAVGILADVSGLEELPLLPAPAGSTEPGGTESVVEKVEIADG